MIVIAGALIGALWGGWSAKKRGGSRLDILQYAAVYAIALALVGMIATVFIERAIV